MAFSRQQDEIDKVIEAKVALLDALKEAAENGLASAALDYATAYTVLDSGKLPGQQLGKG